MVYTFSLRSRYKLEAALTLIVPKYFCANKKENTVVIAKLLFKNKTQLLA